MKFAIYLVIALVAYKIMRQDDDEDEVLEAVLVESEEETP